MSENKGEWSLDDGHHGPVMYDHTPGSTYIWCRECCPAEDGFWLCTRREGHTGRHAAGDGDIICAVWND